MKGDFSRIRFNPAKQYTAVLEQQGRVSLDADANEQQAIDGHLRQATNIDVIGRYGGPIGDAGFAIEIVGDEIRIGRGRYYVDGILVENADNIPYDNQPCLIDATYSARELLEQIIRGQGDVSVRFFLEIWQRLVTQLDDPCLREPALGQADTTARLQTVWRVVADIQDDDSETGGIDPTTGKPENVDLNEVVIFNDPASGTLENTTNLSPCCQVMYKVLPPLHTGAMGADTGASGSDCGCQPVPSAGYQGLENQLYRIEIHTSGTLDTATFKWSRENASVVTAITTFNGAVATVSSIGPDANLGYQVGQWVELTDDSYLFGQPANQPGSLYQVSAIQSSGGSFLVTLASQITGINPALNARMRRWDQSSSAATGAGLPLSAAPTPLENGIEVTFRSGHYIAGDYWTIPARTATGKIDWPPCGSDGSFFQHAQFTRIYTAPLACLHPRSRDHFGTINENNPDHFESGKLDQSKFDSVFGNDGFANDLFIVDDCRRLFPPLTDLTGNTSQALHVASTSWVNDDVITVDTFVKTGLFITLDQAPTCPWSGGNFRVTIETPLANDALAQYASSFGALVGQAKAPDFTDVFLRTEFVLDPPDGITVSGNQVTWLLPPATEGVQLYAAYWLFVVLNGLLVVSKVKGYARVRVKLQGSAVYGDGDNGNIYLDGESFGATGKRVGDGTDCIQLNMPSGASLTASDFEGWFYLAPTVLIASVVIQGAENGTEKTIAALRIMVNSQNAVIGYQIGETASVTNVQAVITLTYAPIADTVVNLAFSGAGAGTVVTIQPSVTFPAGQISVTVPISIPINPGATKDTVTLIASIATALATIPYDPAPTLTVTGVTPPVIIQ